MARKEKTVIGRIVEAHLASERNHVAPAKIDTGADSSSIWASDLSIDDNYLLHYTLFGEGSPYYTGKRHTTREYRVRLVRSSNGTLQVRYSIKLTVTLGGRTVRGSFTLADRSQNTYPILIGNRLLYQKFLVDVSIGPEITPSNERQTHRLNKELAQDPKAFFEKYHLENQRGDVDV